MNKFKGLVVRVPLGCPARIANVDTNNGLKFLQGEVHGYIELVVLEAVNRTRQIVLWINEEGWLQPDRITNLLFPCPTHGGTLHEIVGSAVITATNGTATVPLTEDEAKKWLAWANTNRARDAAIGRG